MVINSVYVDLVNLYGIKTITDDDLIKVLTLVLYSLIHAEDH